MKKWMFSFAVVLGLLASIAAPARAAAPVVYRLTGDGAGAYYSSVDQSGCIYTNIFAEFSEEASGSLPKLTAQPTQVYMYIMQWDACQSLYLRWGVTNTPATLPQGAVQLAPSLMSATLNATIELVDVNTSLPFNADVSITWQASGPFERSNHHDRSVGKWGIIDSKSKSISRDAIATGSVIVDGVNLTPSPWSGEAWVEQQIQGSITIFKP